MCVCVCICVYVCIYECLRVYVCLCVVHLCGCMEALASSGMWNILTTVPLTWVIASVFFFALSFFAYTERDERWPSSSFLVSSVPQRGKIAYLSVWRSWINNNIPLHHDSQTTISIQPGAQKVDQLNEWRIKKKKTLPNTWWEPACLFLFRTLASKTNKQKKSTLFTRSRHPMVLSGQKEKGHDRHLLSVCHYGGESKNKT